MILLIGMVVAVSLVPLLGGDLGRLVDVRPRWWGLLPAALFVQVLIFNIPLAALPGSTHELLHVVSYVMIFAALSLNRHIEGWYVLALGGLLNLLPIAANGGVMPADPELHAGLNMPEPPPGHFVNSAPIDDANLALLGDVILFPGPGWMSHLFSIGDVVLVVGLAVVLQLECWRPKFATT